MQDKCEKKEKEVGDRDRDGEREREAGKKKRKGRKGNEGKWVVRHRRRWSGNRKDKDGKQEKKMKG